MGNTPEKQWFMSLVANTNDPVLKQQMKPNGDEGNTTQGLYIVSAGGQVLGFNNAHPAHYNNYDIGMIRKFIDQGLKNFRSTSRTHEYVDRSLVSTSKSFTSDSTSVVNVFTRISPAPEKCDSLNRGIGRDHLWILPAEVESIVSPAHDDGAPFALPPSMVARIVRFHLVDNVRGEPDMWIKGQVTNVTFHAKLISGTRTAKTYSFQGGFKLANSSRERGFEGSINGVFEVPTGQTQLSRFRALAKGQAWGRSRFTPGEPTGKFPLVIAMVEATDDVSRVVPPQAYYPSWPDEYLKPNSWSLWDLVQPFVQPER